MAVGVQNCAVEAKRAYNINEASKACGLSPSVLRIWELRYGWPNPKRLANGYRAYGPHLIEDLKRIAVLVKAGTPIRQLIVDGLPQWPADPTQQTRPRTVDRTRSLRQPRDRTAATLQRDLLDAVERRQAGVTQELLQRAGWLVRPADEPLAALVPIVAGLAELHLVERQMGDGEDRLHAAVRRRCDEMLRRFPVDGPDVSVLMTKPSDESLAGVIAVGLRQAGLGARICTIAGGSPGAVIAAGSGPAPAGTVARVVAVRATIIDDDGDSSLEAGYDLIDLFAAEAPSWVARCRERR